jgi:hypothetical protein
MGARARQSRSVHDITSADVAAVARAQGIDVSDADLEEVTHRLNVTLAGLDAFPGDGVASIDPLPMDVEPSS